MDGGPGRSLFRRMQPGLLSLLLSLVLAGCAGSRYIALPPTVVPDPIRLSDPRLIQDPPAEILAHFTLDAQGYIIDGPRSRTGEPVDHTRLLTNKQIVESFAKVALSDSEGLDLVYSQADADEESDSVAGKIWKYQKDIGQEIFYRGGIVTAEFYQALDQAVKGIAENTRLQIPMLSWHGTREALAYIFVQDLADMQRLANDMRALSKEAPSGSDERENILTLARTFDTIVREELESCFGFSGIADDGTRGSSLIIFFLNIPAHQLESCAYEETIQSMGLFNDDDSLFNTMFTDSFKAYLFPTELDWMMLRILYDDRLENGMTPREALPIVRQILKETRPHGEDPAAQPVARLK